MMAWGCTADDCNASFSDHLKWERVAIVRLDSRLVCEELGRRHLVGLCEDEVVVRKGIGVGQQRVVMKDEGSTCGSCRRGEGRMWVRRNRNVALFMMVMKTSSSI